MPVNPLIFSMLSELKLVFHAYPFESVTIFMHIRNIWDIKDIKCYLRVIEAKRLPLIFGSIFKF